MRLSLPCLLILPLLAAACQDTGVCEEWSVERDGQCAPADLRVRLTHLDVRYDLSQPVHVNNRVPVTFGLTADSVDPKNPVTRSVAVTFSFVEANPGDPDNPLGCSSSAIDVEVTGDGSELLVDGFIWPTTLCAGLAGKDVDVNLQVDFDGGAELASELESTLDAPTVVLSEARRNDPLNQLCRASLDTAEPGLGCVHAIKLEPTPTGAGGALIDVRYGLSAGSSVAVLPFQQTDNIGPDGPADVGPSLVVQSSFVVNGRDPYVSGVDPALIPPELIAEVPSIAEDLKFGLDDAALAALSALPGKAVVTYTLRAASDSTTELPLTVRDPADPANRVTEVVVDGVMPGTAHEVVHELFIEGATLDAFADGGAWADESDFIVRGCFKADFAQGGNQGDGNLDDCRELEVLLARERSAPRALALSFDKDFESKLGGSRISVDSTMSTRNRLDLTGASSSVEAEVALKGKIGKSFNLKLARAFATATVAVDPTKTAYEVGVDAFDKRIYSVSEQAATIVQTEDFSAAKSFTIGSLGFGFGPAHVGIKIGVGGTIGFEAEDTLEVLTDSAACQELLNSTDALSLCGRMTRVTTPTFGLTGKVEGGINLKIVKAAVAADVRFITTSFPLDTTLGWGLTDDDQMLVRGDVTWDMSLQPLSGNVSIVGKVGIRRFAKSLKVNVFSFSSPTVDTRLLSHAMDTFEVLQ